MLMNPHADDLSLGRVLRLRVVRGVGSVLRVLGAECVVTCRSVAFFKARAKFASTNSELNSWHGAESLD